LLLVLCDYYYIDSCINVLKCKRRVCGVDDQSLVKYGCDINSALISEEYQVEELRGELKKVSHSLSIDRKLIQRRAKQGRTARVNSQKLLICVRVNDKMDHIVLIHSYRGSSDERAVIFKSEDLASNYIIKVSHVKFKDSRWSCADPIKVGMDLLFRCSGLWHIKVRYAEANYGKMLNLCAFAGEIIAGEVSY